MGFSSMRYGVFAMGLTVLIQGSVFVDFYYHAAPTWAGLKLPYWSCLLIMGQHVLDKSWGQKDIQGRCCWPAKRGQASKRLQGSQDQATDYSLY